jgi:hypothetical protein
MQVLLSFRPSSTDNTDLLKASIDSSVQSKLKNLNNDLFEPKGNTEIVFVQDISRGKKKKK